MKLLQIDSVNGYKPRPDFMIRVFEDGRVLYTGRYYVGYTGDQENFIGETRLREINLLLDFLVRRNQKNYLKKRIVPTYVVEVGEEGKIRFEIDETDIVSDDIIRQIIDLSGVWQWINADLDLYMVMSKPDRRSKELGILRASSSDKAISMYLADRRSRHNRSLDDYWTFCIGHQKPGELLHSMIYFTYSDYQIKERSLSLILNQGPALSDGNYSVYLFISFGKRYNDPKASYFLVLARDAADVDQVFKTAYPHFMPRDFQLVDIGVSYRPIPMFTTQIPVAIR